MAFDLTLLTRAGDLAAHAAQRQSLISENIANADSRGFKARDLPTFAAVYENGEGGGNFAARATRPGHAGYDAGGGVAVEPVAIAKRGAASPNGNTVSLEDQMTRGAEANLQHELALTILRSSINILRTGIGRGR